MRYSFLTLLFMAGMIIMSCNPKDGKKADKTNRFDKDTTGIADITALIKGDSGNASLYQQRAMIYLKESKHNQALRDMITAIEIDPDNAAYMLTLSDIYMSMGLLDNCVESLDRALRLDPGNIESMLKMAEINLIMKKYKEALQYADQAIAINRTNPLPYFIKGFTYAEAGDTVSAIKNYLEAIDKDQSYYDAYIQLGFIYSVAGNRLAVDYFNNALNVDPQSIEALYALGIFYQEDGDAANAIPTYNKLLVVDPANVYAYYNLGYVHLVLLNEYQTAIDYFRQVIELKPDYFEAIFNMGYCYELIGDYQTAREMYSRVLEIEVNYARAVEGLNRIYGK